MFDFQKLETATELELREIEIPFFDDIKDLIKLIETLEKRTHDYGTCVYAMSLSAIAAKRYLAHKLGCSGFQASGADLHFMSKERNMKEGFRLLNYGNLLYPQYLTSDHFPSYKELIVENIEHLAKKARELIATKDSVHHNVLEHWKFIVDCDNKRQLGDNSWKNDIALMA